MGNQILNMSPGQSKPVILGLALLFSPGLSCPSACLLLASAQCFFQSHFLAKKTHIP